MLALTQRALFIFRTTTVATLTRAPSYYTTINPHPSIYMRQLSIRFNAGKVAFDEDTKRCTPLPHKGYITIVPGTDDPDFLQFTWKCKDATAGGAVEPDELVLIPGDVTFKHVKSCTTGRVVALTFLSSGAKHLYWLQDVGDIDNLALLMPKDEAILKDVVEAVALDDDDE